jgi:hypothetical protein
MIVRTGKMKNDFAAHGLEVRQRRKETPVGTRDNISRQSSTGRSEIPSITCDTERECALGLRERSTKLRKFLAKRDERVQDICTRRPYTQHTHKRKTRLQKLNCGHHGAVRLDGYTILVGRVIGQVVKDMERRNTSCSTFDAPCSLSSLATRREIPSTRFWSRSRNRLRSQAHCGAESH